jgi:hypothetical protein
MFFDEGLHAGRPHFHAVYEGRRASYDIADLTRLDGSFPVRIERLVRGWARAHQAELLANWERARADLQLNPIDPPK